MKIWLLLVGLVKTGRLCGSGGWEGPYRRVSLLGIVDAREAIGDRAGELRTRGGLSAEPLWGWNGMRRARESERLRTCLTIVSDYQK